MSHDTHALSDFVLILEDEVSEGTIRSITEKIPDNTFASLSEAQQYEVVYAIDEAFNDCQTPISVSELTRIGVPVVMIPRADEELTDEAVVALLESNLIMKDAQNNFLLMQEDASQDWAREETDEFEIEGYIEALFSELDDRLSYNSVIHSIRWDIGVTTYDDASQSFGNLVVNITRCNPESDSDFTKFWLNLTLSEDGYAQNITVVKREEVRRVTHPASSFV